ncbi:MAG TPA: hypothetical protein VF831_00005, partial [Anaerolineales bacterium]
IHRKKIFALILLFTATTLGCSLTSIRQQVSSAQQTTNSLKTKVSGAITAGGAVVDTAQGYETEYAHIRRTVEAWATQGASLLSKIQGVGTYSPGLVQTAQSFVENEIPTGEPPSDIPLLEPGKMESYYGSSQYIFYITSMDYIQVLGIYQTSMPHEGWQYLSDNSHEYARAAQLSYYKDTRTVIIDISVNSLNDTTVVIINIMSH